MAAQESSLRWATNVQEADALGKKCVLIFLASWDAAGQQQAQLLTEFERLQTYPSLTFARVDAEAADELCDRFEVTVVPTVVCVSSGCVVERIEGGSGSMLADALKRLSERSDEANAALGGLDDAAQFKQRLQQLINTAPAMLFMKGSTDAPKCGFSRTISELLVKEGVDFATFDILQDDEVRQGLKKLSDWPTFPQLYVNGELVGGLDIVQEMIAEGDLKGQLGLTAQPLEERLKELITKAPVVLFMKGSTDAPKCGFSRTISELLVKEGVDFATFDILQDDEVRQGLKKLSDWPTFPQLYVNGELVGGLDIVQEMIAEGNLKSQLGLAD